MLALDRAAGFSRQAGWYRGATSSRRLRPGGSVTDSSSAPAFVRVDPAVDLSAIDARILAFWDRIDAFATSVQMRPPESEYTFYDGPPFATGSPHYGHILQGVVKDIVPRYWTMRGHRVERRFGWDTHGLPVEMEVQKLLGVNSPRQIEDLGVARFNQAARDLVSDITTDWYDITRRIGRWVDFDDDYKTMDLDYMESVWWGFKQLWDRGLVYKTLKVVPYSWGAATPLSNFEVNLGGYRDVDDPSLTVRFRVLAGNEVVDAGDELVVWTTTPWTLPGNLAVAVGYSIDYVRVAHGDSRSWVARQRLDAVWPDGHHDIVGAARGADLLDITYEPPFSHFETQRERGAFRIIAMDEVTTEDGTGLVHLAPAYGEADFAALKAAGIDAFVDPVDAVARFTDEVPEVAGMYVKDADPILVEHLEDRGRVVRSTRITHPYPFCWRTDTPLIYKAVPSWYVAVASLKDRMVAHNDGIHWVPDYVGSARFGNWLEDARDWAISRNRFWGTTIPVWECDGCDEQVCVGSIDELETLSGVRPDDLHKDILDPITWLCATCRGTMRRVPEVLDTWFDSGSMPYAQIHYPFENADRFEAGFPADFIAEGLDQTRGWFYTLLVLSTGIFDVAPFQHCIVTGMLLAEDGRKMSKSVGNFTDPSQILDEYGADAMRAYLINSPVLRADPLRFKDDGVREVVRTVLLPLWNAFSFFTTYAEADRITADDLAAAPAIADRPEIDRWIHSVLQSLIADVNREMESYRLFAVIPPIIGFVDFLTNWYIRRSRRRFWTHRGDGEDTDKLAAFATLYEVLTTFATVAAPVLPFITEEIYQGLVTTIDENAPASIHHVDYPTADRAVIDPALEKAMADVRTVVTLGRGLRKRDGLRVRQPLETITVISRDPAVREGVSAHSRLIREELNVREVEVTHAESDVVELSAKADFKRIGPRFGERTKAVAAAIAALDHDAIGAMLDGDPLTLDGERITAKDLVVSRTAHAGTVVASSGSLTVALDTTVTDELRGEGLAREIVNRIQTLRRDLALDVTDHIAVGWSADDDTIREAFDVHGALIAGEVLADSLDEQSLDAVLFDIDGSAVYLGIEALIDR
ncbi:MAG: isoleucine--tRNA ligase [Acidimicrobiia bacterium]|nr:MAG: isoleucine--tRNA ligase [Acidimicrobiia bacterium]